MILQTPQKILKSEARKRKKKLVAGDKETLSWDAFLFVFMRNYLVSFAFRIQSTTVTDSGFPRLQFPILYRRDPCLV